MLYINTRITDSSEAILAPGAVVSMEGQAMVAVPGKGISPSAGTSGEIFAGFATRQLCGAPLLEPYANAVEHFVVGSSANVILQFAPLSADAVCVFDITNNKVLTGATVSGKTVSATGLTAGIEVKVTYKYALTNIQARALMGDAQPGGPAGLIVAQCGLAKRGLIFTSCFDASVNWSAATAIKLDAGGIVTDQTGSGTALPGAYVVQAPTAEVPFLGIEFSAA